ncbi:hypothetical protein Tco_0819426 [Tanacetum coccineum]|uniref:Uncharacterized protein n=1 Tax=Tanacetum coccineum TaxID=301880 RepID=A0ABQ5A9L9_9ASTR
MTALTLRYEVEESLTAAPRPARGHGIDYGFIGTLDAETKRQRAKEVGYEIRDTWVDPTEAAEEIALVTLEGVNTRVTELAAMQEQDTQDISAVIEDAQDRQTRIFQSVETLINNRQYTMRLHDSALTAQVSSQQGHLAMALSEIRALQARDQACANAPEGTDTVMSSDSASSEEPDSSEAAPALPDYMPGPEEPKQAPLSPDYVPGPEYPEYLAPSDEEVHVEDQPYAVADSPIALSPSYVADSDSEEDSEDGLVVYPADGGDDDDDDSSDNDEEDEEASEEEEVEDEEDEHLAPADSVVDHVPSFE